MKEEILKEFEEFGELYSFPFGLTNSVMGYKFEKDGSNSPISGKCDTEEIKSFLSNVISQTEKEAYEKGRLETIKEIEEKLPEPIKSEKELMKVNWDYVGGFNIALMDVKSILNQLKDNE